MTESSEALLPTNVDSLLPIEPPEDFLDLRSGEWGALPKSGPVIEHITQNYWPGPGFPDTWKVARFSKAVYLFQEQKTRWTVVVKFYSTKTASNAEKYAARELQRIEEVQALGLREGRLRAIRAFGAWRGVLFLEYVPGLTLADLIAVRQSHPGRLKPGLVGIAQILAKLHQASANPAISPAIEPAVTEALKIIAELERHGVLENERFVAAQLRNLVNHWSDKVHLSQYTPCLIHGDTTTTNFVFPDEDTVVAIDWERLWVGDPAADLGRLAAEIAHSLQRQGGHGNEAEGLFEHLYQAYFQAGSTGLEDEAFIKRASFYQASSTLRIARNGWVPRLERMILIAQAMSLLAS